MNEVFNRSVKPAIVEELIDYYVFRRLAALLVPMMARRKLTPNQVSWVTLASGLFAAWVFLHDHFFVATLLLWMTVVLDCCDGMLARFTGQTSPIGRVVDGLFDAIWVSAIWWAIYRSGHLTPYSDSVLDVLVLGGFCTCLHCWTFDGVKNSYLEQCRPDFHENDLDFDEALKGMKDSFHRKKIFDGIIYALMTWHQYVFGRGKRKRIVKPQVSSQQLGLINRWLDAPMRLWTFVGEGTHLGIMIVFGLMTPWWPDAMMTAFWIILVPINLVWIAAIIFWNMRKQKLFIPTVS